MKTLRLQEHVMELRMALGSLTSAAAIANCVSSKVQEALECDAVFLCYNFPKEAERKPIFSSVGSGSTELEASLASLKFRGKSLCWDGKEIELPLLVSDSRLSRHSHPVVDAFSKTPVRSFAIVPLLRGSEVVGWIGCFFVESYQRFRKEDGNLLQRLADTASFYLELEERSQPESVGVEYETLIAYGNLLIVRTDRSFRIEKVQGDPEQLLGIPRREMLEDSEVWRRFLATSDFRTLLLRMREMGDNPHEFSEELRVHNERTGKDRWVLVRAVPTYTGSREFIGWDGFAIDITEKREAEDRLRIQQRRLQALFEVTRSLEVNMDPALVALRGLRALIQATDSCGGFSCFFDSGSRTLELVAAQGLSGDYINELSGLIQGDSLVRTVVETGEGVCLGRIDSDTRPTLALLHNEGVRSAILMPLTFEDEVVGVTALFSRRLNRYTGDDVDLIRASAGQIGLVARKAEDYAAEKKQADSLATMYRLSHELSGLLSSHDVASHALTVLQEELSAKRIWLGVVNEQGTHVVGQAGVGPGVRKHIIGLQIELGLPHQVLDQAIERREAVIVGRGDSGECSGLRRILKRLDLGVYAIVPLVSLGQVVGVLILEPQGGSAASLHRKLPLLMSMGSEIATVILARRFENKIADSEKMRMAGLLASGVAHNFNNLLQTVMGQASLIEMQSGGDSKISDAARSIVDVSERGAALIRQLLSFSSSESHTQRKLAIDEMLVGSRELYDSILGNGIILHFNLDASRAKVLGDYGQIQQVITNLLLNAREAMENSQGNVTLSSKPVRISSAEVDPDLAPGTYLRIDVSDDGVGMTEEQQARCFEPFYTTKNVDSGTGLGFQGSGLGLSSAYSILKQHDGLLTLRSAKGEGSVLSLFLPLLNASEFEKDLEREIPRGLRALLFEVDQGSLLPIVSTLRTLGVVPQKAVSERELISEVSSPDGNVRLVLFDISNFEGDPGKLVREIKEKSSDVTVILCSEHQDSRLNQFWNEKNCEIVEKPLELWAIHRVVRKIVHGMHPLRLSDQVSREQSGNGDSEPKKTTEIKSDTTETRK